MQFIKLGLYIFWAIYKFKYDGGMDNTDLIDNPVELDIQSGHVVCPGRRNIHRRFCQLYQKCSILKDQWCKVLEAEREGRKGQKSWSQVKRKSGSSFLKNDITEFRQFWQKIEIFEQTLNFKTVVKKYRDTIKSLKTFGIKIKNID